MGCAEGSNTSFHVGTRRINHDSSSRDIQLHPTQGYRLIGDLDSWMSYDRWRCRSHASRIRAGQTGQLAGAILAEAEADALQIPISMAGAMARDLILTFRYGINTGRATTDIDWAMQVESWEQFVALKDAEEKRVLSA
jgi:hypothetical protein